MEVAGKLAVGADRGPSGGERGARPLPMTIEEIDREWLTAALRVLTPGVTVLNVSIERMIRGTCTLIWLRLEMDEAGKRAGIPETVVLKGGFEPHSRNVAKLHEFEAQGYRDVFPHTSLPTPKCHFADYNEEQQQGIVIIEDLVASGVTFCHPLKPQTYEQETRRLAALARFHAEGWESPEFQPGGRWSYMRGGGSFYRQFAEELLSPPVWKSYIESPRGAASSVRFHDRVWMAGALDKIVELNGRLPECLTHGDTHLGNLYEDADGNPGFFDSMTGRGSALYEVTYHICGALDPMDRRRWERSLLQFYLDELARYGVRPWSFDEAVLYYRAYLAQGLMVFLTNSSTFQTESINTAYVARFSTALIDNDTLRALEEI